MLPLSKSRLNVVVAHTDKNRYIAKNNDLPWGRALRGDMNFIRRLLETEDNIGLVMGRMTFQSMPRIKGVETIVLTSGTTAIDGTVDGVRTFQSLEHAVDYCREKSLCVVIFGGESVYREALKFPCKMYCTVVEEGDLEGDRRFPEVNGKFENISGEVDRFLESKGVKKSWVYSDDKFSEGAYTYRFFCGIHL